MKKKILITSFVSIITGSLIFAVGCRHHAMYCSADKKAEWVVKKISSELDLNEVQQQKLEQIKKELLERSDELHGIKQEISESVAEQVRSEKFDEDKMNALIADKETKMKEMREFLVSKLSEFHAVLNPQQRQKLADRILEFHEEYHR